VFPSAIASLASSAASSASSEILTYGYSSTESATLVKSATAFSSSPFSISSIAVSNSSTYLSITSSDFSIYYSSS